MGVAPSTKAHGIPEGNDEVNLIPVMGLIMILIPLLLYSFSFFNIQVQPVAAPKTGVAGSASDKSKDEKRPLNLTVLISAPGFAIKMDAEVAVSGQEKSDVNIPKKMFKSPYTHKQILEYDYPALYAKLYEIKKHFKEEKTIHITASPDIRWQIVARVMDASRFILKKQKFTGLEDFATTEVDMVEDGDKTVPRLLFPQVVFVVMD